VTGREEITNVVAIDGPAGAGKSTIARRVAEALGFAFLDTGAMYRAATWNALNKEIDFHDKEAVVRATRDMNLAIEENGGSQRVTVDGRDVTREIRTARVTNNIYKLDGTPELRNHLVELQRRFAENQPTVAEGRDMGTIVFPNARCKIYLDASVDERARRRYEELRCNGENADFQTVREEIARRDHKDMTREVAPLRKAPDARVIDTTGLTPSEVADRVVELARGAF